MLSAAAPPDARNWGAVPERLRELARRPILIGSGPGMRPAAIKVLGRYGFQLVGGRGERSVLNVLGPTGKTAADTSVVLEDANLAASSAVTSEVRSAPLLPYIPSLA